MLPFFYFLVALVICLPVLSYHLSKYIFGQISVSVYITPGTATKKQHARLVLEINNPTRLPVSSVAVTLCFRSVFYQTNDTHCYVFPLCAKDNNHFEFPVYLEKNGLYEASAYDFCMYDFLHLFCFNSSEHYISQVRVFPDTRPILKLHEALYNEGFDEFEESSNRGNVSSNVTDIREYRPGDRLQKIHWKLSSKIDKLMVKENEATSTNEFFLLMELFQPSAADCADNEALSCALDSALDEAWAIANELIQSGQIFVFAVYSTNIQDFVMSTIRSESDLEESFYQAYYQPTYDTDNLALDIYRRSGLQRGTLLHVTHQGVQDVTD